MTVPEIRARALDEFARSIEAIAEAVGKRAGRPADDLAVRTVAGAVIGVIMSIMLPWEDWSEGYDFEDRLGRIDEAARPAGSRPAALSLRTCRAGLPGMPRLRGFPRRWHTRATSGGVRLAQSARMPRPWTSGARGERRSASARPAVPEPSSLAVLADEVISRPPDAPVAAASPPGVPPALGPVMHHAICSTRSSNFSHADVITAKA